MSSKSQMVEETLKIRKLIGNTPMVKLDGHLDFNLFAKLEYNNFSGSIKDRAANNIIFQAILEEKINSKTTLVESSSGNFGISLALHCKRLGLDFVVVVDPHINEVNLKLLKVLATEVIMVNEPDETGGYLLNRIKKVKEIVNTRENCFWTNQYENKYNYEGYIDLAHEIKNSFSRLDYLFVSTSSCGTISGLSKYTKQSFPNLVIVAVDIKGSLIFSDEKSKRYISGLGAGKRAVFLEEDTVNEVIILNHKEIILGCQSLLQNHSIFAGGSSGACYYAANRFINQYVTDKTSINALIICPDRGLSYLDNIYNDQWAKKIIESEKSMEIEFANQV